MQKITISSKMVELNNNNQSTVVKQKMEPKKETLNSILQFASTYRVEKIAQNQFVEMCLN